MARQFQIPGGPFVNAAEDGREYALPGSGYFNDVAAGSTTSEGSGTIAGTGVISGEGEAPGSGTITLTETSGEDGRIYQRVSGVASIGFAGTYTGSPAAIQARIVEYGTSTEVVTWTTIDASPSGGTFSASLASVPEGGWYERQVRFSDDTGVTDAGTHKIGVGILIACVGQSNMDNMFTASGAGTVNDLTRRQYGAVASPATAATWASFSHNNGAHTLADTLQQALGVPVGLLDYAVGGTSSALWKKGSSTGYANYIKGVTDAGGGCEIVLYHQGEYDAAFSVAQATYEDNVYDHSSSFIKGSRADITNRSSLTNLPIVITITGRSSDYTDADLEAIRAGQVSIIGRVADVFRADASDVELSGSVHYTTAGYQEMGRRYTAEILYLLGESTARPPRIDSYVIVNSTTVDVIIEHRGGTDFTPTTDIKGFEAFDDGSPLTISAAVQQDTSTIRLTVSPAIAGTFTLRYLYGADGGVTFASTFADAVYDNQSDTKALQWSPSIAAVAASEGTGTINGTGVISGVGYAMPAGSGSVLGVGVIVGAGNVTGQPATTGSGAGWHIDFAGIETRISEERADREDRRRSIQTIFRRATGQTLPDDKPAEAVAAEMLSAVKPAARKRMQTEIKAIAEINQALVRLEKQIEDADVAYIMAEERDIVWIVSEYV